MSYDLATEIWVHEHVGEMLQEAKEARLLRSKEDPRAPHKWQSWVMQVFESLSCLFTRCPDVSLAPQ